VILADTSIWIDYFRAGNPAMREHLRNEQIVTHPFVLAELALGSLHDRRNILAELDSLPQVQVARLDEVRSMIEAQNLYSKGIGLTDVHLIASCLITPGMHLWTRDARLGSVAKALGIHADLPLFN
jgi:predicted nucleic acid-binding protein